MGAIRRRMAADEREADEKVGQSGEAQRRGSTLVSQTRAGVRRLRQSAA